jgi:predicted transcriptional regulator of viral defense system
MADSRTRISGRHRLAAVIRQAGDVVRIDDAARTLNLDRTKAAKLLARWTDQGWLRRVGSGSYVPVALELLDSDQVVEDPWVLVPALFAPAYIGGRTAAEHWDLTEQLFRDVVVFTAKPLRERSVQSQGALFSLKHVREEMIFGTKSVWRGQSRIAVSDVHRTIVDMLDDPAIGGGIQHVEDCFRNYLARSDASADTLIDYALRLGNGAVFKRLGFLAQRHPAAYRIAAASAEYLTKGYAKLDPALECSRIITRWRLRIPESWREAKP